MINKIKDAIYTKRYVYNLHFHLIWCTKYRNKTFTDDKLSNEMKEILQRVADDNEIAIEKMEVMPDHVHLLLEVDPQFGIHKVVKRIKGISSRILREEFSWLKSRLPTLWTNSYFVSTVGGAPISIIKQYIESQKRSE